MEVGRGHSIRPAEPASAPCLDTIDTKVVGLPPHIQKLLRTPAGYLSLAGRRSGLTSVRGGESRVMPMSLREEIRLLSMVDVFGPLSEEELREMALTGQSLQGVYVRALAPSTVVSLRRGDLEDLIVKKPEVGLRLVQELAERLRASESRYANV